jgi:hypothetical protein
MAKPILAFHSFTCLAASGVDGTPSSKGYSGANGAPNPSISSPNQLQCSFCVPTCHRKVEWHVSLPQDKATANFKIGQFSNQDISRSP